MGNYFAKTDPLIIKVPNKKNDAAFQPKKANEMRTYIINEVLSYNHSNEDDSDIVRCEFNGWLYAVNKSRGELQRKRMKKSSIVSWVNDEDAIKCLDVNFVKNKAQHNTKCLNIFQKSTASQSSINPTTRKRCSQCYRRLHDKSAVFMCDKHSDFIICPLCHGYKSERQIYKQLICKMSALNKPKDKTNNINIKNKFQSLITNLCHNYSDYKIENIPHEMSKIIKIKSVSNMNKILTSFRGNDHRLNNNIPPEICVMIMQLIGSDNLIKIANDNSLFNLFNYYWSLQCFKTLPIHIITDKRYAKFGNFNLNGTAFSINKLDMSINEFCDMQNDKMYRKYIQPNSKDIDFKQFKSLNLVSPLFVKEESKNDQDYNVAQRFLFLGKMLQTLCGETDSLYSFHAKVLKIRDYSYLAHPHYPGGPGQVCGHGYAVLFRIGDDAENNDMFLVMAFCGQGIGL